jgi:hypothetical protein
LATDASCGERLLQPLTHCPDLVRGFLHALDADGADSARPYGQRLACARCLLGLLRRGDQPRVPPRAPPGASPQALAAAVALAAAGQGPLVENLLHAHKASVHTALGEGLAALAKVSYILFCGARF